MRTQLNYRTIMVCLIGLSLLTTASKSQNGTLDLSFGNGGKVITNIGTNDNARSVALQSDGKIVVGGSSNNGSDNDFAIVRYNINGTLDATFGIGGVVTTDIDSAEGIRDLAILSDGKIMVVGYIVNQDIAMARYNSNGTLDNTFGIGGIVISNLQGPLTDPKSMLIQTDGKIVVVGNNYDINQSDFVVIRYNTDGTFDNSFGIGGIKITDLAGLNDYATSIALQTDGKIVISGYTQNGVYNDIAVLRFNTDGTADNTFGNGGVTITAAGSFNDYAHSVAIQSDGKIVVGGRTGATANSNNNFLVVRYNTNGTLDNSFGNGGISITANDSLSVANSIAIQNDGKIILGGHIKNATFDMRLDCYDSGGILDNSFGNAGIAISDISSASDNGLSIVIQNDSKIVIVGYGHNGIENDFILARFNYEIPFPDGINYFENQKGLVQSYPNPFSTYTTIKINSAVHDATLIVYNTISQPVKQLNHLSGKELILCRDDLPMGFYSIQIIQENKTIATGSIIVAK